jgi:hypothetical protein
MGRLSMWGARLCGLGLALLAALGGAPARADCPPAAVAPDTQAIQQGMAQAQNHGFLWTLDRQGHRSWLYGTIHAAQQAWMYPGRRWSRPWAAPAAWWWRWTCPTPPPWRPSSTWPARRPTGPCRPPWRRGCRSRKTRPAWAAPCGTGARRCG